MPKLSNYPRLVVTVLALLIGYPMAYAIAGLSPKWRTVALVAIDRALDDRGFLGVLADDLAPFDRHRRDFVGDVAGVEVREVPAHIGHGPQPRQRLLFAKRSHVHI